MRFWSVLRGLNTSAHAPRLTLSHNREQVVISFFIRAPIRNMPILSAVLLAVALVALQLGVIDPYIVDEISQVWKTVEINGTAVDSVRACLHPRVPCVAPANHPPWHRQDLRDVTDRLESLETLFNVTI